MHKTFVAGILTLAALGALGTPAFAGRPGPGDKQCVPGQQGNPHPGAKAGVCAKP